MGEIVFCVCVRHEGHQGPQGGAVCDLTLSFRNCRSCVDVSTVCPSHVSSCDVRVSCLSVCSQVLSCDDIASCLSVCSQVSSCDDRASCLSILSPMSPCDDRVGHLSASPCPLAPVTSPQGATLSMSALSNELETWLRQATSTLRVIPAIRPEASRSTSASRRLGLVKGPGVDCPRVHYR